MTSVILQELRSNDWRVVLCRQVHESQSGLCVGRFVLGRVATQG